MKFRTLSEAKAELGILVRLAEKGETVVISRHGKPAVRLAPIGEDDLELTTREASKLNSWLRRERAAGRTREYSSMEELLKKTRPRTKKSRA
jgi:prevent-host-death family protein